MHAEAVTAYVAQRETSAALHAGLVAAHVDALEIEREAVSVERAAEAEALRADHAAASAKMQRDHNTALALKDGAYRIEQTFQAQLRVELEGHKAELRAELEAAQAAHAEVIEEHSARISSRRRESIQLASDIDRMEREMVAEQQRSAALLREVEMHKTEVRRHGERRSTTLAEHSQWRAVTQENMAKLEAQLDEMRQTAAGLAEQNGMQQLLLVRMLRWRESSVDGVDVSYLDAGDAFERELATAESEQQAADLNLRASVLIGTLDAGAAAIAVKAAAIADLGDAMRRDVEVVEGCDVELVSK